ncbi:MAG TPA: hypothetical protein VMU61_13625 [Candidatus Aquilonibacter sp.]|nr:hypothetical protein [Candidatus Aquilonibacter sp.]
MITVKHTVGANNRQVQQLGLRCRQAIEGVVMVERQKPGPNRLI